MLLKMKKGFILFLATVILCFSISMSAYKPLQVHAVVTEAAVSVGVYELICFIIETLAVSAVSYGIYEVAQDPDVLYETAEEFMTALGEGQLSGWIGDPEIGTDETGSNVLVYPAPHVLTPEEQEALGLGTNCPTKEEYNKALKDYYDRKHSTDSEGGGGGGGGEDPNDPNNKKLPSKDKFTLSNLDLDFVAKASVGFLATITEFWDKVFDGEIDTSDSPALNKILLNDQESYCGELTKVGDLISVRISTTYQYNYDYVCNTFSFSGNFDKERMAILRADGPYGSGYYDWKLYSYYNGYNNVEKISYIRKNYNSNGELTGTTSKYGYIGYANSISANVPIFYDSASITEYLKSGDDTGCVNKTEKDKFTAIDWKTMNASLPSTLGALASLPAEKAVPATALKDYVDEMTAKKDSIAIDSDEQTKVATDTMNEIVEKTQTDIKTDPEPDEDEDDKTLPAPLPEFPTPDSVDIDGSETTRDWRLVFPFCIPFDVIDLFRVLEAEPEAPRFEIPFVIESLDFEYTLVIDFEDYEVLVKIFRTGEILLFIVGLALLTSKVIKW